MEKLNKNSKNLLDFIFAKGNFIKAIIILWIFFEILYVKFEIDVFKYAWKVCLGGYAVAVIPVFQETIKEAGKQKGEEAAKEGFQNTLDKAKQFILSLCRLIKNNRFFPFAVIIAIFILIPSASAHCRLFGRLINFVADMNYEKTIEDNERKLPQLEDKTENGNEQKEEKKTELKKDAFLTDIDRYFQLSHEEKYKLYFETANLDWSDINDVSQAVTKFVESLRMEKKFNKFDINAPEHLKGEVACASDLEQNMANSDDLDTIINIRMDAFYKYPKYRLAQLLAANQQTYALEYEKISGNPETIEYYYGQSVFWLFECLKFSDVDEYTEKSIIASIKMRYRDISEAAPTGSWSKKRAHILSEAFANIQN